MTKHRLRDSIKSLFGSHIDSENDEQLKGDKIGIFYYIKIMSIRRLEVVKGILETMKFVV
jgi:RecA/RadA recombinase